MPDLENLPIAITMGDACGIGPEIIAKLFADDKALPPMIVIGDKGILERAVRLLALPIMVKTIDSPEEFDPVANTMHVISLSQLPDDLPFGQLDARAGKAAFDYICTAIDLALGHRIRAIVTAPINKESMRLAGFQYPG